MSDRRQYPEFAETLERLFNMSKVWDQGRLASVKQAVHPIMDMQATSLWKGCEALRSFLVDLPDLVGAPDVATFVSGCSSTETAVLSGPSLDLLRQWYAWPSELYTMALRLVGTPTTTGAQLIKETDRLTDIVYADLDPFLMPRLHHWGRLRSMAKDPSIAG